MKRYAIVRVDINCPKDVCGEEDLSNNHKTDVKDGYYLVFPNVADKFSYLDKVYANDNWDIRRGC